MQIFAPLESRLYMIGFMKIIGRETVKGEKTSALNAVKARDDKTARGGVRPTPTHEEIARRAYEFYLARGGEHGHAEEDWARAESEPGA
jgi:hypothetical protein